MASEEFKNYFQSSSQDAANQLGEYIERRCQEAGVPAYAFSIHLPTWVLWTDDTQRASEEIEKRVNAEIARLKERYG